MMSKVKKFFSFFNLDRVTTFVGIAGYNAIYVQIGKILYLGSAYSVSLTGSLITLFAMIFWTIYGVHKHIKPLVIANIFGIVGILGVIAGCLYYGDSNKNLSYPCLPVQSK